MADYIPFDIQTEIIKKLPVKSLIRFQSVSKSWMSLIHNSKFIANYHVHQTQPRHHLLVRYCDVNEDLKRKFVSIVDDDSFPEHKVSLTVPTSVIDIKRRPMICNSEGVLCLYNFYGNPAHKKVVLWNPSIRKSVVIDVPNMLNNWTYDTIIGLGVCSLTSEIKLVKVIYFEETADDIETTNLPWQVEVFTLSLRTWRSPSCTNNLQLPRKSTRFLSEHVDLDGFIYWITFDRSYVNGIEEWYDRILSFDMTNENFIEIYFPHRITFNSNNYMPISKLRESLVLLEFNNVAYDVWMMENGVTKSFKKLFSIKSQDVKIVGVHGFRKSGEPILEVADEDSHVEGPRSLVAYEPHSKRINQIGIYGNSISNVTCSYTETLLLLDHED